MFDLGVGCLVESNQYVAIVKQTGIAMLGCLSSSSSYSLR